MDQMHTTSLLPLRHVQNDHRTVDEGAGANPLVNDKMVILEFSTPMKLSVLPKYFSNFTA